jgi:hypothetical protein
MTGSAKDMATIIGPVMMTQCVWRTKYACFSKSFIIFYKFLSLFMAPFGWEKHVEKSHFAMSATKNFD